MIKKMYVLKKNKFGISAMVALGLMFGKISAQMTGVYTVGPGGDYATLTAAITALTSAGVGAGGVTFEINNTYVSTGETFPIVLPPITGASASNPIRIWRANDGTATRIIAQGGAVPTIRVTGSYYTFDGRTQGTGTARRISVRNTGTTAPAIAFENDARFNTFTYLNVQGRNADANSGVVVFGVGSVAGNDNNTLSNSIVTANAGVYPVNGIYSQGAAGILNDNNTLSNNQISDFTGRGIWVTDVGNGDSWTIDGNSVFCTFAASTQQTGIDFVPGATSENNTISNNRVGGRSANGGTSGNPWQNTSGLMFIGIRVRCATASFNTTITGNIVRNLELSSTAAYNAYGIIADLGSVAAAEFLITNNTIGNAATPGLGISFAGNGFFRGITTASSCESPVQILNNVVGQITATNNGNNARIHGIAVDSRRRAYINQNTVRNLTVTQTANHNDLSWFPQSNTSVIGILYNSTANASGNQINQNTVFNLYNNSTNNSTTIARVSGIVLSCSPWAVNANGTCSRNRVYNLETSNPAANMHWITGIDYWAGNNWTFFNNQISLTNGTNANDAAIFGFWEGNGIMRTSHFHNNSIYVGGTSNTSASSAAYFRTVKSNVQLRNNIFYNERTLGGTHVAVSNVNFDGAPADGWAAGASNYNLYVTAVPTTVGGWGPEPSTVFYDFSGWRSISNSDAYSLCTTAVALPSANFFTSTANGDLNIQNNIDRWYVNGKGIAGPLVQNNSIDFTGTSRSTTQGVAADIGSIEITAATPAPHLISQNITGTGTYYFNFAGNTYAKAEVTVYDPSLTTLSIRYYSGVNPANTLTATKSNGYYVVSVNPGAANYAYNLTLAFTPGMIGDVDNLADVIVSRSQNCGGWYHYPFVPEAAPNTTLSGNEATVSGLTVVGTFAFSDKDNPLAFPLPLSATPTATTATVTWQNSALATGATLRYRPIGNPTYTVVTPGLVTSYDITGLSPSTNYEFNVRSTCGGNTAYTRNFTFTTPSTRAGETTSSETVLYPNPTTGELNLRFATAQIEKALVTVSDLNGRVVLRDEMTTVAGDNQWTGTLEGKPAGLYFLQVVTPSLARSFKVTLQ